MKPQLLYYRRAESRRRRQGPLSIFVTIVAVWAFLGGSAAIFGNQTGDGCVVAVLGLLVLVNQSYAYR